MTQIVNTPVETAPVSPNAEAATPVPSSVAAPASPAITTPAIVTKAAIRPRRKLVSRIASVIGTLLIALAVALFLVISVGPRLFSYQISPVLSGSMEPTIHVGSVVFLSRISSDQLKVGDVITFNPPDHPEKLVTHRIAEIKLGANGRGFITKGDANNAPDAWVVRGVGEGWRYEFNVPYLGYILIALEAPLFRLCFLIIPAVLLAGLFLKDLWFPKKGTAKA